MHSSRPTDNARLRPGMTLVEIVAAITLAATLLVSVLTAYGQSVRQARRGERRLIAIRLADRLMAEWFRPGGTAPLPGPGETTQESIAAQPGWAWRLQPIESRRRSTARSFEQYRLEVLMMATATEPEQVLTELEFVGYLSLPAQVPIAGGAP